MSVLFREGFLTRQAWLTVLQYLHGQFCSERGLVKGMRHKHVVGHNGLDGALYYFVRIRTRFFVERCQVPFLYVLEF